jgi:predicted porin
MKKSLIALAVLAASGAAMAQSSVTLYGIADVWLGSVKVETGPVSTTQTLLHSGGVSTSRWGLKGSEDLGGGLKANFQLEQAFSVDTGAGGTFNRESWVGFSGGFGAVQLGLTGTPFDKVQGLSDAAFDSDLAPANNPAGGVFRTSNDYTSKPGNQIFYQAPTFGGFSGAVSYSLDEDTNFSTTIATPMSITSMNLTYAAGPVGAQFAYQKEDRTDATWNDLAYLRLGASYNFGIATAKVMYGKVDNTNNVTDGETTEWQVGADFPVSQALTLSASYAKSDDNDAAGGIERKGLGLAAAYSLSKRTTLYGGLKTAKATPNVGDDTKYNVFAVGVKHSF